MMIYIDLAVLGVTFLLGWGISKLWIRRQTALGWGLVTTILGAMTVGGLILLALSINNHYLVKLLWLPILSVVSGIAFLLFSFLLLIIINAVIVWRKESHNLANLLTLILSVGFLILSFFQVYLIDSGLNDNAIVNTLKVILYGFLLLMEILVADFVITWMLYQTKPIPKNIKNIVVLGSGLINGKEVSPLLRQRILKAILIYEDQVNRHEPAPKIIFSGGKGSDENLSEGEAMYNYGVKHGVAIEDAVMETESKTTYENLLFSKELVDNEGTTIIVTTNYHTLRAGRIAKKMGLNWASYGAFVSSFFIPNALIREFVAVYAQKKKTLVALGLLVFIGSILYIALMKSM